MDHGDIFHGLDQQVMNNRFFLFNRLKNRLLEKFLQLDVINNFLLGYSLGRLVISVLRRFLLTHRQ